MPHDPQAEAESRKRLVALMIRHQRQIFSYIYVLVPNRTDAEDLTEEEIEALHRHYHDLANHFSDEREKRRAS